MKDFLKSPVSRQVVIFVSPIVVCPFLAFLLGVVEINDIFEVAYNLLGYLLAFMVAIYVAGWIISNLVFLLIELVFKKETTTSKRFWWQLLLSQLLVIVILNYLITTYVLI